MRAIAFPADGRVILAATLQIEEGALTGESVAVEKSTEAIAKADVSLGDRTDMAFMNTVDLAGRFVIRSGHRPGGTPIGGVMGLDTPTPGIMDRKPDPSTSRSSSTR